jgi:hypothetical protein
MRDQPDSAGPLRGSWTTNGAAVTSLVLAYLTPPLGGGPRDCRAPPDQANTATRFGIRLGGPDHRNTRNARDCRRRDLLPVHSPRGGPGPDDAPALRLSHCSTVCISITLYTDHIDRLKYTSLPVDQGCIIGA